MEGAFKDTNFSISNKFAVNNAEKTLTARLNEEESKEACACESGRQTASFKHDLRSFVSTPD